MKTCIIEGCSNYAKGRYCVMHYTRLRKTGKFELKPGYGEKRKHPLYIIWFDRKKHEMLSTEWEDFWEFVRDVSPKPDGEYFLVRDRGDEPYGPTNFRWQAHLKRREGESKKDWWARKWQARHAGNRGIERKRDLYRKYGITVADYDRLKGEQFGLCAVCKKSETSRESKTGTIRNLAVDHNHSTGKVRGLLCWSCNSCIGRVGESTEILKSMIAYLEKHQ